MPVLSALFTPRRIALVGASEQEGRIGALLWRNLESFPGEVVPVTRSVDSIAGRKAYPSLAAVPGDLDLAVVVLPAVAVPEVVRDAGTKGVPVAIVLSGGFAEAGPDGARLQRELVDAAEDGGVRIVGPNCFGVQYHAAGLNASIAVGAARGGGIALVTQSGAYGMAIHTAAVDEGGGVAAVCATGNTCDVTVTEVLDHLAADPAVRTLCLFLESLPDGRAFAEAASRITPHSPVVVAKTGRSAAGARAVRSHTAALAGSERVWRAAFARAGVVLARSGLEMIDTVRALDSQPAPAGPRVGIVTNSGGTGVELADLLADEGLDVPELSAGLQDTLRPVLPGLASPRNPVDLTPVWSRFAELYPLLVDRLARSGEVDAVVAVLLQRAASAEVATGLAEAVAGLRADGVGVPVYVCWVAPRAARPHADLLQAAGVPCFDWPERTARAVGHAARYAAARNRVRPLDPLPAGEPSGLPDGWLDLDDGARLLGRYGIATVPGRICSTETEAAYAAAELGYPAVVKVVHPGLLHKAAAGGVRVGLPVPTAVRAAATELLALAPGARLLVQRQVDGTEVVVGGVRDPQFGPVVMAGLGGVLVEALDDVALGLPPLGRSDALDLLTGLRGRRLLDGVDTEALADTVVALARLLVAEPDIAELDLNPVLATARGCVAVDWRIRVGNPPAQDEDDGGDLPHHAGEMAR